MGIKIWNTDIKNIYVYVYETVHVTGVSVSPSSVSLTTVWQTEQLTATITPANADDQVVSWSSSNTSVATVNSSWLVTCVAPWEATITVTTNDGGYTSTCEVNDWKRHPWPNTLAYYTLNNDGTNQSTATTKFSDVTLNTATYTTTKAHGTNTHSLYCDGSTYAYVPASALHDFWTNDFTFSCWVYSETNSWQYPWFVSNVVAAYPNQWNWAYRISDRFSNVNQYNFCWDWYNNWQNVPTWTSIKDWWHNCIVTRINRIFYVYLDWNQVWTITTRTDKGCWVNGNIFLWYNLIDQLYSKCYLNDVIFENRWWSAQNVSDYYALTNI